MMYYGWVPEWWTKMMGGLGEGASETIGGGLGDLFGKIGGSALDTAMETLPDQLAASIRAGIEKAGIGDLLSQAFNPIEAFQAKIALGFIEQFKKFGDEVSNSWNKVDQRAFDFGKQVGLSQRQVENLRESIINLGSSVEGFGAKYGKTLDELIKMQSDFATQIGRTVRLTNEQYEDLAALSGIVGDEMAVKFAAQLESFGMSTTATSEMMTKMYNESLKKGITLQAYSKNVSENLHLAQQYTFKNGVNGLMKMAENAAKMKMDMQQVVSLGNKLAEGGVESAVNMAAELQVLGGAFAQFADPLGLLHDSLLDMDGLSDRLTGLVGEMGHFDKEQGKVVIDPFQQMQLRQAAKSMGLDYGKLIESATQQAKRKEIETQMTGLSNIPKEYKELIMNTAQFKNGRAGVTLANGEFKELNKLTHGELVEIADLEKDVADDVKDIKKHLIGAEEVRQNTEKELENQKTIQFKSQSEAIKGIYTEVSTQTQTLQQIAKWQMISSTLSTAQGMFNSFLPVLKPILNMVGLKFANGGMIKTHSEGDLITNGMPGKEYVLNSAQYGEFIVNAASTKHHLALLRAINGDKHGQLRFKQYEDGGVIGMGFGASSMIPGMGGMGMMGNIYQLQMMGKLNEGIKGMTTGSENFIRLNKLISTQQKGLDEMLSQRDKLMKKFDYRTKLAHNYSMSSAGRELAAEEAAKTQAQITKLQGKIDNTQSRLTKTIDKQRTIASRGVMMNRLATGGMSIMAGVSGYMSAKAQYEATGEAIMEKQKAQAGSVGKGIGSAAGAALGAFAGPIGMMIGSTVGGWIGQALGESIGDESQESMNATRDKLGNSLASTNALGSNKFLLMKGNYYSKEQQKIANALKDGHLYEDEIDEDLAKKIMANGNTNLIEKHARGGWIKGRTHAAGGEIIGVWEGKIHEAEDSEAIIPADKAKKSVNLVNGLLDGRYNDTSLTPIEPMGKQMKVSERYAQNNIPQSIKVEPITININGSIKLESDGRSLDITKEVGNNPILLNKIADLITKQFNIDNNFALDMKKFRQKYI